MIDFYTNSRMTIRIFHVIVGSEINRTTGPERKGNAADSCVQFKNFISPV